MLSKAEEFKLKRWQEIYGPVVTADEAAHSALQAKRLLTGLSPDDPRFVSTSEEHRAFEVIGMLLQKAQS